MNPFKWVSRYGSIVATSYDVGATDGMNEKGLAVHGLWLDDSDYGSRNENIPGISLLMVIQYYLDSFGNVDEAIKNTESGAFQILPFYHPETKRWIKVHLALEDASGDSVIIEYINGMPKVYHSRDYTVMTNEPVYSRQLENLKQYSGFGGDKPLPGTDSSPDRFVRAAWHGAHLPPLSSPKEAVAGVVSILQNASPPFAVDEKLGQDAYIRTLWRTVSDLTHHVYYFISTPNFTTIYASLDKFNLQAGAPVMKLDLVKYPELSGDVTALFQAV